MELARLGRQVLCLPEVLCLPQIVCLLRFDICLSQGAGLFQVAEALDGRAEDHGAGGDGHPESAGGTECVYQPA